MPMWTPANIPQASIPRAVVCCRTADDAIRQWARPPQECIFVPPPIEPFILAVFHEHSHSTKPFQDAAIDNGPEEIRVDDVRGYAGNASAELPESPHLPKRVDIEPRGPGQHFDRSRWRHALGWVLCDSRHNPHVPRWARQVFRHR